jgi:hypothetical protein
VKHTVFWVVMPCSFKRVQLFRETYCLHPQDQRVHRLTNEDTWAAADMEQSLPREPQNWHYNCRFLDNSMQLCSPTNEFCKVLELYEIITQKATTSITITCWRNILYWTRNRRLWICLSGQNICPQNYISNILNL